MTSALVGCGNADWVTSPRKDLLGSCLSGGLIVGRSLELQWSPPPEDPPAYVRSNRAHKKPEVIESLIEEEYCDPAGNLRPERRHCPRPSRFPKVNAPDWRRGETFGRSGAGQNWLRPTGALHLALVQLIVALMNVWPPTIAPQLLPGCSGRVDRVGRTFLRPKA